MWNSMLVTQKYLAVYSFLIYENMYKYKQILQCEVKNFEIGTKWSSWK